MRAKRAKFTLPKDKSLLKVPKTGFEKVKFAVKQRYQTKSTKIGQNAKIEELDFFDNFQTMWLSSKNPTLVDLM